MIIATAAGRLGRDAELRMTNSGMAVCKFSIGCDRGYGDKKATEWVQCVLFDKRAEGLAPHLKKGMAVTVMGEAKAAYWSKDGEAKGAIEIIADKVTLQSKSESSGQSGGMYEGGGGETPGDDPLGEDAIPFISPYEFNMKKDVV